jgi:hypothetical protein
MTNLFVLGVLLVIGYQFFNISFRYPIILTNLPLKNPFLCLCIVYYFQGSMTNLFVLGVLLVIGYQFFNIIFKI